MTNPIQKLVNDTDVHWLKLCVFPSCFCASRPLIPSIEGGSSVALFIAILHHKSCAPWAVGAFTGQIVPAQAIVVAQSAISAAIGSNPSLFVSKDFVELWRSSHLCVGRENAASSPAQGWFTGGSAGAAGEDMPDLQHGFEEMSIEDAGTGQPKDPVQPCTEDLETLHFLGATQEFCS